MIGLLLVLALFVAASVAAASYGRRCGPFGSFVAAMAISTVFLKVVFPGALLPGGLILPGIAMAVTGAANPLPVPAVAFWSYLALVAIGALLVASSDDQSLREFWRPVLVFLRGDFDNPGRVIRRAILWGVLPLLVGWLILRGFVPSTRPPIELRLAHPTISYDPDLENPFRDPSREVLKEFAQENGLEDQTGTRLAASFRMAVLQEGRHLYGKYCSPCHGGKADGTGPVARALRLRPVDFTDPGTIATLVEGYAFQRIMDGGTRLPLEGAPWDSAMPSWKGTLSEEEVFKILLAEYDLAGVSPRVPEKLE